jgi:glutathione S-transferase
MLKLYDNAFSPFARKVRMVLELKKLAHEVVDGLALVHREALARVNPRVEVPAIDHDGVVVVGSADIVAYLERAFPEHPVYPASHAEWVHARAWERCADTVIDPILIDVSYWLWADRADEIPAGMLDAARSDMDAVYTALERDLEGRAMLGGDRPSIADVALFPHITATRMVGLPYDAARFPAVHQWTRRLRAHPVFAADLERVKAFLATYASAGAHERKKIFWRGDRIEWVLARGYHAWFMKEIAEARVIWPGLGIPGPRAG